MSACLYEICPSSHRPAAIRAPVLLRYTPDAPKQNHTEARGDRPWH